MKPTCRWIALVLLVAAMCSLGVSSATADTLLEYTADFEGGGIPDGWIAYNNTASTDSSVVSTPRPVHTGTFALQQRILPTTPNGVAMYVGLPLPDDGYKYEMEGWAYIDVAYNWGMTADSFLFTFPGGQNAGFQMSANVGPRLGYYGVYTGVGSPSGGVMMWNKNNPLKMWRHFKVTYDRRTKTEDIMLDGAYIVQNRNVGLDVAPTSAWFGTFGAWRLGNATTNVLDDLVVRVWTTRVSDTDAPITTHSLAGTVAGSALYRSPVVVTLSATDAGSGVAGTEYSLDGGSTWSAYTGPITVGTQGESTVTYRSSDVVGNTETAKSVTFTVDTNAPSTTHALSGTEGDGGWYRSAVTVALSATDAGAGVAGTEYSLDGGSTWSAYTGPITVGTQGESTVTYRSTDVAGNTETAKSVTFKIDSIAPEVTLLTPSGGAKYGLRSAVVVDWSATDGGSGLVMPVQATLSDGAALPTGKAGVCTFFVTATDAAGNSANVTNSYSVVYQRDISQVPASGVYSRNRTLPIKFWLYDDAGSPVTDASASLMVAPADSNGNPTGPRVAAPALPFLANPDGKYQTELRLKELTGTYHVVTIEFDDGTEESFFITLR